MFNKEMFTEHNSKFDKGNNLINENVNILHFETEDDYKEFIKDFPITANQISRDVREGRTLLRISKFYEDGSIILNTGDKATYSDCNIYTYKQAKEAFKILDYTNLMI